jgi:hypothetical protein
MPLEAAPGIDELCHAGEQHGQDSGIGQLTADFRYDDFDSIEACLRLDVQDGRLCALGSQLEKGEGADRIIPIVHTAANAYNTAHGKRSTARSICAIASSDRIKV